MRKDAPGEAAVGRRALGTGSRAWPAWASRRVTRVHHRVFRFIFTAETAISVFCHLSDSASGSTRPEDIMETTALVVLGRSVSLSAESTHYKCHSQDIARDLNFRPTAQHRPHFIPQLEPRHILSLQHFQSICVLRCTRFCCSRVLLHPKICCVPQIWQWARRSCTSGASLAKLHGHTAIQEDAETGTGR